MAGDWIKFELATPDKPEVWEMAARLGVDPDAVTGKLLRVWGWFDQHTKEGNAPSVTKSLLDRLVGVNGFCNSMIESGWMVEENETIYLPNFDRHNGKTAKQRALTAKRVAEHKQKSNEEGNGESVTSALPREEKRREEETPPCSPPAGDNAPQDDQKANRSAQAREVFDYWASRLGKSGNIKFTADRKRKVEARLREGYTVDELKQAVDGILNSPHHMGENEQGVVYDDLGLICRKGEKTDHFIQLASKSGAAKQQDGGSRAARQAPLGNKYEGSGHV
jgi:hypothetical protein